jgi:ribonuclease Y
MFIESISLQIILGAIGFVIALISLFLIFYAQKKTKQASLMLHQADEQLKNVKFAIDTERREAAIKLKDETYRKRKEFELELKRERLELDRLQSKLNTKYECLEKKEEQFDEMRRDKNNK